MPAGTPIRLVRENLSTIELDAQSMVLTTTRKVGGKPLPFAGSRRIGMDLNMNSAMINIQGIISDDRTASGGSPGQAYINFGKQGTGTLQFAENGSYGGDNNLSGLVGSRLRIRNISNTYRDVSFTNTGGTTAYSATGGAGSTPTVLVNTTSATADQIATAVTAFINAQYSADFTATVVDDIDYRNLEQPVGVSILMATTGEVLDNGSPYFTEESAYSFTPPAITPFFGGATGTKKSAGDKAMDLYGILNNSTTKNGAALQTGILGGVMLLAGVAAAPAIAAGAGVSAGAALATTGAVGVAGASAMMGGLASGLAWWNHEQGYILGIQIPYNSMIQAGDGELYTARNFFMPTGGVATGGTGSDFDKTSDSNTTSASTSMNFNTGEKAGIQGSVQKMDITYNAGETVYEFNMIFAPVDNLL
jgi:hypothetical protein